MFKKALLTYFSVSCFTLGLAASDVGRVFPSEASSYEDPVTGAKVQVLTHSPAVDVRIYQTHPQWTADGEWIVFRTADRSRDGYPQIYAVRESDGTLVQLTEGPGLSYRSLRLSRKENILYFLRDSDDGQDFIKLDLDPLFADSAAGQMREEGYETILATFPYSRGMLTLDSSERIMYYSVEHPEAESGETVNTIVAFDLEEGTHEEVVRKPFRIGHIQANPHRDGEILFCHETGGDAPQRMWIWREGMESAEPLFVEEELDWVTHEAWADEDHVVFNLMGHTPRLRQRPTGIALINVRTNKVRIFGQPEPISGLQNNMGFWHCNVSPDGRWIAGDTFSGNVYLIDIETQAQHLLTTGHVMRPDHAHPSFSSDSRRVFIQSGRLSDGESLDLMVVEIPEAFKE